MESVESYLRLLQWGAFAAVATVAILLIVAYKLNQRLDRIEGRLDVMRDLMRERAALKPEPGREGQR